MESGYVKERRNERKREIENRNNADTKKERKKESNERTQ